MNFLSNKPNENYFMYLQSSPKNLDLNDTVQLPINVFPKNIYSSNSIFAPPIYSTDPTDISSVYFVNPSNPQHPPTFSKFNYPGCQFGYCYGPTAGGYYGMQPSCYLNY